MKKIRVNWAAAMSAFAILMGIGGIVGSGTAAGVTENLWWLIGCVTGYCVLWHWHRTFGRSMN